MIVKRRRSERNAWASKASLGPCCHAHALSPGVRRGLDRMGRSGHANGGPPFQTSPLDAGRRQGGKRKGR